MRQYYDKTWAKVLASFLCVAGGLLIAVFFSFRILMLEVGNSYDFRSPESARATLYRYAGDNTAAIILSAYTQTGDLGLGLRRAHTDNIDFAIVSSAEPKFSDIDLLYSSSDGFSPGEGDYDYVFEGGTGPNDRYYYSSSNNLPALIRAGHPYAYTPYYAQTEEPSQGEAPQEQLFFFYRVKQPLPNQDPGDVFRQAEKWASVLYTGNRFLIPAVCLGLIMMAFSAFFLVKAAGRREGKEGISLRFTDSMPFEVLFLLCLGILGFSLIFGLSMAGQFGHDSTAFVAFGGGLAGAAIILDGLLLLTSFSVRIKSHTFTAHSLVGKLFSPYRHLVSMYKENTSLFTRTALFLFALFILQFAVMIGTSYSGGLTKLKVILFLIYKVLETGFVLWCVLQMSRIDRGVKSLVAGENDKPIDTAGLSGPFKEHACHLNRIGEGITAAIDKQMRSERMKTELVANVTHDIKTPLTSIINYVDLLDKEELSSEKAASYVDVLKRQSAKLKKLVDDLMDASKASTGNLELKMESCSAAVLIAQAMGEFEDRFKANALTPVIADIPENLSLLCDSRYIWRILDNLLSNIVKYSLPGTRVYLDASAREERVALTFKNISRDPINVSGDELTERFVRGDASRNTEGSGLGLTIAGSLAALMDGDMAVAVDGDLFKVTLSFRKG